MIFHSIAGKKIFRSLLDSRKALYRSFPETLVAVDRWFPGRQKRALPFFTRPPALFGQVDSKIVPFSSTTIMFFSMGVKVNGKVCNITYF